MRATAGSTWSTGGRTGISDGSTRPRATPEPIDAIRRPRYTAAFPSTTTPFPPGPVAMPLTDLVAPDAIVPALKVNNKKQAIQELANRAARLTGQNERVIFET